MKKDYIPLNFREKNKNKISLAVSIVVLLVLFLLVRTIDNSYAQAQARAEAAQKQQEEEAAAAKAAKEAAAAAVTASFIAVGDNFYESGLLTAGQGDSDTWNYDEVYSQVSGKIAGADMAIVQQPTVLTTDHDMISGSDSYATPTEVGDALVNAGFDVIASAGDHADDYGTDYLNQTLDFWSGNHADTTILGIHKTQEDADNIQIREVNGINVAFLNYTYGSYYDSLSDENTFMVDYFQQEKVASDIAKAKESSDCIIVIAQWGTVDNAMPSEYQKQWTQFLLSQGVKVVIGAHPHVLQPMEILTDAQGNEMLVYYSLGDFANSSETAVELLGGMAEFTLEKTEANGQVSVKVTSNTLTPTVMHYNSGEDLYQTMLLSDYTDELAAAHTITSINGEGSFTVNGLNQLFTSITSMTVTPSTNTDLLAMTYNADGSMSSTDGSSTLSADELAERYPADTSGSLDALWVILTGTGNGPTDNGSSNSTSSEDTSSDEDSSDNDSSGNDSSGNDSDSGYDSSGSDDSDSDSNYNSGYDSDSY